jgi:hypothetical protein
MNLKTLHTHIYIKGIFLQIEVEKIGHNFLPLQLDFNMFFSLWPSDLTVEKSKLNMIKI